MLVILESEVRKVHGASSSPHSWQPTSMTTSQWSLIYQSPLGKKSDSHQDYHAMERELERRRARKWAEEIKSINKVLYTELKKGEAEVIWTTRWGTRRCEKRWCHLLHESSVDVWNTQGMKSLTQQWKETMVLKIAHNVKGGLISLNCN